MKTFHFIVTKHGVFRWMEFQGSKDIIQWLTWLDILAHMKGFGFKLWPWWCPARWRSIFRDVVIYSKLKWCSFCGSRQLWYLWQLKLVTGQSCNKCLRQKWGVFVIPMFHLPGRFLRFFRTARRPKKGHHFQSDFDYKHAEKLYFLWNLRWNAYKTLLNN